jgi:hypothetical protein
MPQGDKSRYPDQQKRQAEQIENGCEKKGFSTKIAEGRAWATVHKLTGGGKKNGPGRNKKGWLFVRFSQTPAVFTPDLGHTP